MTPHQTTVGSLLAGGRGIEGERVTMRFSGAGIVLITRGALRTISSVRTNRPTIAVVEPRNAAPEQRKIRDPKGVDEAGHHRRGIKRIRRAAATDQTKI